MCDIQYMSYIYAGCYLELRSVTVKCKIFKGCQNFKDVHTIRKTMVRQRPNLVKVHLSK